MFLGLTGRFEVFTFRKKSHNNLKKLYRTCPIQVVIPCIEHSEFHRVAFRSAPLWWALGTMSDTFEQSEKALTVRKQS